MKNFLLIILGLLSLSNECLSQNVMNSDTTIIYHVNENVKNSSEVYFIEIQKNWENYLNSNYYVRSDNEHWNHDVYLYPDFAYVSLLMHLRRMMHYGGKIQCSTIAIVPVKNDFYLLKTVFTESNTEHDELVDIKFIISVYAKKKDDKYEFYSSTAYHREICQNQKIGGINYIIHPEHNFVKEDAIKMNNFNTEIATLFELEPLEFDYIVSNNTRDLSDMTGLNLFSYSYQPIASGGMADNYNNVIYAGNNSGYYPHEVVHLYTNAKYPKQFHRWIDEGIAALLGGSTGYKIEWHWEKLRRFLIENPDYKMNNLSELETLIPNGEFMTDFRYAIGALICQRIIDKEGMQGIFEALQSGRTEDNYFDMLEQKLGVKREDFGEYVKSETLKLVPIQDEELKVFEY